MESWLSVAAFFGPTDNCSIQQILLGCQTKCPTGWKMISPGLSLLHGFDTGWWKCFREGELFYSLTQGKVHFEKIYMYSILFRIRILKLCCQLRQKSDCLHQKHWLCVKYSELPSVESYSKLWIRLLEAIKDIACAAGKVELTKLTLILKKQSLLHYPY